MSVRLKGLAAMNKAADSEDQVGGGGGRKPKTPKSGRKK